MWHDEDEFEGASCTGDESHSLKASASEQANAKSFEKNLAKDETTAVRTLRVFVLFVLVAVAVSFSVTIFFYMKSDEAHTFDQQFHDLGTRLVEGFQSNTKLRLQVMDMLCVSITSSAKATHQAWPFVTIEDFDARVSTARSILGSTYVGVYPVVSTDQREEWEAYTQVPDNIHWTNQSFAYQEDFQQKHGYDPTWARRSRFLTEDTPILYSNNVTYDGIYGTSMQLYRGGDPENHPADDGKWVIEGPGAQGPFLPMWQMSPTLESNVYENINCNLNDNYYPESYTNSLMTVVNTSKAAIGGVWNVDDTGYIDEDDDFDQRVVPAAALMYPIFDNVVGEQSVVAIAELDFEFGSFFTAVLPPNANAITCVVSNCDQTFSFEVTGETATYLGIDDLHDTKYTHSHSMSALMTDFDKSSSGILYSGAPVSNEYCPWELHVYATQDMEDAYVTNQPYFYMAAVLGVFSFTCFVFFLYDFLVEMRQKKVVNTAVKSDKIVASLFPGSFRDAMYDQHKEDESKKTEMDAFANRGSITSRVTAGSVPKGDPMAQLYPECTVLFADLAGFTKWSSSRTPTEVFTLLETLYTAFDKVARRLNVFKVETIGDCYVAVTGLPTPQERHALIMTRFAARCLTKMNEIVNSGEIRDKLGDDTSNLMLRVGMHSGPVVAGVLRGEKQRFQLFGDSVNTAARMESNGQMGRIHVSSATADLLRALGKSQWLTKREDLVEAKGKGKMQCYWVNDILPARSLGVASFMSSSIASSQGSSFGGEDDNIRVSHDEIRVRYDAEAEC